MRLSFLALQPYNQQWMNPKLLDMGPVHTRHALSSIHRGLLQYKNPLLGERNMREQLFTVITWSLLRCLENRNLSTADPVLYWMDDHVTQNKDSTMIILANAIMLIIMNDSSGKKVVMLSKILLIVKIPLLFQKLWDQKQHQIHIYRRLA